MKGGAVVGGSSAPEVLYQRVIRAMHDLVDEVIQ